MTKHKYTAEEEQWLRENYGNAAYTELAVRFSYIFSCCVDGISIKNKCRKLKITETHCPFTLEQDTWLKENCLNYANYEEVAEAFNMKFHTDKTPRGIQSHCARYLKLKSGRQAFKKGNQTWNKMPVGYEITRANGYTYVKANDTGIKNQDFIEKHRMLWEQYHACKVPDGHIVVFLNSDCSDFSEENLYCIPRKICRMMNTYGWFTESREHTLTAIKWCELYYSLKDLSEQ